MANGNLGFLFPDLSRVTGPRLGEARQPEAPLEITAEDLISLLFGTGIRSGQTFGEETRGGARIGGAQIGGGRFGAQAPPVPRLTEDIQPEAGGPLAGLPIADPVALRPPPIDPNAQVDVGAAGIPGPRPVDPLHGILNPPAPETLSPAFQGGPSFASVLGLGSSPAGATPAAPPPTTTGGITTPSEVSATETDPFQDVAAATSSLASLTGQNGPEAQQASIGTAATRLVPESGPVAVAPPVPPAGSAETSTSTLATGGPQAATGGRKDSGALATALSGLRAPSAPATPRAPPAVTPPTPSGTGRGGGADPLSSLIARQLLQTGGGARLGLGARLRGR